MFTKHAATRSVAMKQRLSRTVLAIGGIASVMMPVTAGLAHMPYVLPSAFEVTRDRITIEASFGEDAFRGEIAMKDAPFEVTGPDGRTVKLAPPTFTGDLTIVEAALPADGMYRLSSGQRLGRMGKMYRKGSVWQMVGEGGPAPAGAMVVDVRSATIADAYVLRGKPGATGALAVRGKALEIRPLGDPTTYAPGSGAAFEILYDGKPLAHEAVTLFREHGFYDGRKQAGTAVTDAAGKVTLILPDAGRYLALVRHRAATPAAADAFTSFTATLAFEAM